MSNSQQLSAVIVCDEIILTLFQWGTVLLYRPYVMLRLVFIEMNIFKFLPYDGKAH